MSQFPNLSATQLGRTGTGLTQVPSHNLDGASAIRRRSTRRSGMRPSADGGRSKFTLAGVDEAPKLAEAHEPYVHPGYAALNPAYEQPANAKPVWSLAKPLPRVIRPGMVPTKSEILDSRLNAELPGENSQKLGLDVDPNDLEKGEIKPSVDPRKVSAQLKDSRAQRENTFLNTIQRHASISRPNGGSQRISRVGSLTSSARRRRASTSAVRRSSQMSPALEGDDSGEGEKDERPPSTEETRPQQQQLGAQLGSQLDAAFPPPARRPTALDPIPESRPMTPTKPEAYVPAPEGEQDFANDGESLTTLGLDEEPALLEDMEPLMENFIEDEVHNNHTAWSLVRTHNREFLAELLAVFVQITFGFCADLQVTLAQTSNPDTTAWAWGLSTMTAIYISGGISGAHLNPVITIMLWFYRGFPKRKMPAYFIAQFLGAFIAALTAYGLYRASIQDYEATNGTESILDSFVTSQRHSFTGPATAFFNEFLGVTLLVIAVLALGDDQNAPPGAGMNSLIIGLVIVLLNLTFTYQTGAALNPARDFGPRLAMLALGYKKQIFTNPFWFYGPWAGTVCGAFMGGFLYDAAIFTGGESPVNYPLTRTKRALKKSKRKWKRRLHLATTDAEAL
ncbi:aquaporin-like protein [Teratosphaeria nubilosa]|uniref:Aquaporin-like protein n=1 Tax=Teratosphaeria nubilosa TaxID=161662 RepID=A0A6G1L8F7_9PEZI|nr:aquaporin-like protein [Teratosphaeria nubilosa]